MPIFHDDGVKIHYQLMNKQMGSAPILLCLHGWGTNSDLWYYAPKFLKDRRLMMIDLPGMGKSTWESCRYRGDYLSKTIAVILKLLDSLKISEIEILAHSIGGGIACGLIASGVKSRTLILDSVPLLGEEGLSLKVRLFGLKYFASLPLYACLYSPFVVKRLLRDTCNDIDGLPSKVSSMLVDGFVGANKLDLYQSLRDSIKSAALQNLKGFKGHVLYIAGGENRTLDVALVSRRLKKLVPQANVKEIAGGRHYIQLEQPEIYYKIVKEVLRKI